MRWGGTGKIHPILLKNISNTMQHETLTAKPASLAPPQREPLRRRRFNHQLQLQPRDYSLLCIFLDVDLIRMSELYAL